MERRAPLVLSLPVLLILSHLLLVVGLPSSSRRIYSLSWPTTKAGQSILERSPQTTDSPPTILGNLIVNPSLEDLSSSVSDGSITTLTNTSTLLTGWTVTSGNATLWHNQYNVAYSGHTSLLLGPDCRGYSSTTKCDGATVQTSITVVAGQQYFLSFLMNSLYNDNLHKTQLQLSINNNGTITTSNYTMDSYFGAASDPLGWLHVGPILFTPVVSTITLSFTGLISDLQISPPFIDQITVMPVLNPGFSSQTKISLSSPLYFAGWSGRNIKFQPLIIKGGDNRQSGMVLYYKPIYLTDTSSGTCTARSFSTMFAFKATSALGLDGFTFSLTSLPVMGAASLGLGYAVSSYSSSDLPTFQGSLSVEFDVIANGRVADINKNHIGVNVAYFNNGSQAVQSTHSLAAVDATVYAVRLLQAKVQRRAWVIYDAANKDLKVFLRATGGIGKPITAVLSVNVDLCEVFGSAGVPIYVGFTSSSNTGTSGLLVTDWTFTGPSPA